MRPFAWEQILQSNLGLYSGLAPREQQRLRDLVRILVAEKEWTGYHGLEITEQEAWTERRSPIELRVPDYIRQTVEQLAFSARDDKKVDKRSGVSQRLPISVLENVVSNSERRALKAGETVAAPRVMDIYAALPSITGKLELEYEGELKGGDAVARELIKTAVGKVYTSYFDGVNVAQIVQWFELGGSLKLDPGVFRSLP